MSAIQDGLWFLAGLFTALAVTLLLWTWFGDRLRWSGNPAVKWPAIGVLTVAIAACLLAVWPRSFEQHSTSAADASVESMPATGVNGHGGDSLQSALAKLEARLRSGNGSAADWSLLAQTYEYLGRTSDAQNARSRHVVAAVPAGDAGNGPWPAALVEAIVDTAPRVGPTTAIAEETAPPATVSSVSVRRQVQQLLSTADKDRATHDYSGAKSAYEQVVAFDQMSAQNWADFADVMASLNAGRLDGAPTQYIMAALKLNPANEKALWLQASAQHEDHQYALAIATWTRLLALIPAGSEQETMFAANLAEDQRLLADGAPPAQGSVGASTAQAGSAQLIGEVHLAGTLGHQVPAGLTLFIVARSLNSPGAPVAVVRTQTGAWPVPFRLDDSLAMVSDRKLSTAGAVTVEARISQSGAAASAPGDLASRLVTVEPHSGQSVHLVIDHILP
jgi:cytochrome c-type biogenesis protein CcmH/NrfG